MDKNFDQYLMSLIKRRRSVRIFTGEKIPREKIFSIIEAGIWAPTGCNNQELRFLILDEDSEINEFVKFKPFLRGVSAFLLVFCDMSLPMSKKMYLETKGERHLPYVDAGLAVANMILYAKSNGIDSCVFNLSKYHFKYKKKRKNYIERFIDRLKLKLNLYTSIEGNLELYFKKAIKIPKDLKIICGVALGFGEKYPDVNTETHGGKKIMREKIDHYIIHKDGR
ncbi:MAG: nitroreductase family protein [Candidatus Paceibacterota bacterium]|jgi:nitroreductase